jgi:hypothetical protein
MAKKKSAGAQYFGKPLTGDPDDAPELLTDFFRHGELRYGDRQAETAIRFAFFLRRNLDNTVVIRERSNSILPKKAIRDAFV